MPDPHGARGGMLRNWQSASVSIAKDSAISSSILLAGRSILGLQMPTAFTGSMLSFDAKAYPGGEFLPLYDEDGNQLYVKVSASRCVSPDSALLTMSSFYGLRIRSGSTVAKPENQGAARTIWVFMQG